MAVTVGSANRSPSFDSNQPRVAPIQRGVAASLIVQAVPGVNWMELLMKRPMLCRIVRRGRTKR